MSLKVRPFCRNRKANLEDDEVVEPLVTSSASSASAPISLSERLFAASTRKEPKKAPKYGFCVACDVPRRLWLCRQGVNCGRVFTRCSNWWKFDSKGNRKCWRKSFYFGTLPASLNEAVRRMKKDIRFVCHGPQAKVLL